MRILRGTLLVGAIMTLVLTSPELVMANPIADNGPAIDSAILTVDPGAENALVAELNNTQKANGEPYVDTEVDYVILVRMANSDVSFLGFDCAILPADDSKPLLKLGSTEQAVANSTEQVDTATINSALRPSSGISANSVSTANFASALNVRRTDHNS